MRETRSWAFRGTGPKTLRRSIDFAAAQCTLVLVVLVHLPVLGRFLPGPGPVGDVLPLRPCPGRWRHHATGLPRISRPIRADSPPAAPHNALLRPAKPADGAPRPRFNLGKAVGPASARLRKFRVAALTMLRRNANWSLPVLGRFLPRLGPRRWRGPFFCRYSAARRLGARPIRASRATTAAMRRRVTSKPAPRSMRASSRYSPRSISICTACQPAAGRPNRWVM